VLVADSSRLAAVVAAVRTAGLVAFDLEFDTRDRLVPALCLLQVACVDRDFDAAAVPDDAIFLVDPMAVDCAPVVAALQAHSSVIAHAPRQDLWVLAAKLGARVPGLVDTQLMAAFAGIGDQVGLGSLVRDLIGVTLDKDQQWTAWARRPLSDRQLAYAADDVRYLPRVYRELAARLAGRLDWVRDETASIARDAEAAADPDPEVAWRDVGGVRGLGDREMGALKAIAAWRVDTAVSEDRPLGHVLPDKPLVELARARPRDADGVLAVHGLTSIARAAAGELAAVIADAPPMTREQARGALSGRAQRWSEVLLAIANVVADRAGVAARLLATRGDAEAFARAYDGGGADATRGLPAATSWRRDVLLPAWDGWLAGRLAVVADAGSPHGIQLAELAASAPPAPEAPAKAPAKTSKKPSAKAPAKPAARSRARAGRA
jgi:ribonuclease D